MIVEFELNLMGMLYLFITVGLVCGVYLLLAGTLTFAQKGIISRDEKSDWLNWLYFSLMLTGSFVCVGLLFPVVRHLFKAYMPSV